MRQFWQVSGTVVDSKTATPVVGATVRLIGKTAQLSNVTGVSDYPTQGVEWTRCLSNFAGSRWDLWDQQIKTVPGLTWADFVDAALVYNPQLNADGRLFKLDKIYLVPENVSQGRACASQQTDSTGEFHFSGIGGTESFLLNPQDFPGVILPASTTASADTTDTSANYVISVEADGYTRWLGPLVVNGDISQKIELAARSGMRSLLPDYATLPPVVRKTIDQALAMLGDDTKVYDSLPPGLQKMVYGSLFVNDPTNFHYKDIVCADLISICFSAAGVPVDWNVTQPPGEYDSPHKANHYRPAVPQLVEITDANDWLPCDVLIYGTGDFNTTALGHANLYIGPFSGNDLNGRSYQLDYKGQNYDVVEASMDYTVNNQEFGEGVVACTKEACLTGKRGLEWVRRVRLVSIAQAFGK